MTGESCSRCGAARDLAADLTAALAWVAEHEQGTVRWLCPQCAREHVRDIEAKLTAEYW